jgi:uncharacterized protein YndB with AHSA1/START domain
MVPDRIERDIMIAAPIERVWAVITEPEHVGRWFGDAGAKIDLRPGGEFRCSWEKYGSALGVVVKVEPPTFFSYRWARPLGSSVGPDNSTLVEFTLTPEGKGTRLRVVESGFRDLNLSDEDRAKYAGENYEGWGKELEELAGYISGVVA